MRLNPNISFAITKVLSQEKQRILKGHAINDMSSWAIHPGGKRILELIQSFWSIPQELMAPSIKTYEDHGNMSSPTIMFVLKEILDSKNSSGPGCGMAFGPGVTLESFLYQKVHSV